MRRARSLLVPLAVVGLVACGGGDDERDAGTEVSAAGAPLTTSEASSTAQVRTTAAPGTAAVEPAATAAPAPTEGFPFTDPEGTYTIVFPGEPRTIDQQQPLPDGTTLPLTIHYYEGADAGFTTNTIAYPDNAADLDGAVQGMLQATGATLIESTDIELQGRTGKQVVASVVSGVPGTLIARIYVQDNRLWQILYTGAGDHAPADPEVAAFFDSLQFTEGG